MKTVTMRVDDSIYDMIKLAAQGQKRDKWGQATLNKFQKDKGDKQL